MKSPYVVVTFAGEFNGATLHLAARCKDALATEIRLNSARYVALYFREVEKVDRAGIPAFTRFSARK